MTIQARKLAMNSTTPEMRIGSHSEARLVAMI
jgi:hypothetical protein